MYLVKKGTIAIRKMKGGAFVELGRIYSNEVIGELSFFARQPRSAAAVALTEVEVLEISFKALDKIYENVPDYLKTIMASVADRLRKANDTIRRLQRNVIHEDGGESQVAGEEDAPTSDILSVTSEIEALLEKDTPASSADKKSTSD